MHHVLKEISENILQLCDLLDPENDPNLTKSRSVVKPLAIGCLKKFKM